MDTPGERGYVDWKGIVRLAPVSCDKIFILIILFDNLWSYDMKVVTKEWSTAEKNFPPVVGFEPGPPR